MHQPGPMSHSTLQSASLPLLRYASLRLLPILRSSPAHALLPLESCTHNDCKRNSLRKQIESQTPKNAGLMENLDTHSMRGRERERERERVETEKLNSKYCVNFRYIQCVYQHYLYKSSGDWQKYSVLQCSHEHLTLTTRLLMPRSLDY